MVGPILRDESGRCFWIQRAGFNLRPHFAKFGDGFELGPTGGFEHALDASDAGLLHGLEGFGAGLIELCKQQRGAGLRCGHGLTEELAFELRGELFGSGGVTAVNEFGDERGGGFFQRLIQALDGLRSLFAVVFENGLRAVGMSGGKCGGDQQEGEKQVFHGGVYVDAGTRELALDLKRGAGKMLKWKVDFEDPEGKNKALRI